MYIPKEIVVGAQTRSDTFTGKLAYVVYKDHKGILRKEKSWNGWRDKNIEPLTFENKPTNGFTFNKGVKRDGYWGSGRSVIRVWDPRDFEFEISVDNLIGILMHADVSKRDITEPCVFAWYGTELVLLPTNSAEYQESVKFTENQQVKFSTKELTIGHTYQPRTETETVVYLGRLPQYELKQDYNANQTRAIDKGVKHVFIGTTSKQAYFKSPSAFIARCVQDEVSPDFPTLMDEYYRKTCSQPIVGVQFVPKPTTDGTYWSYYYGVKLAVSPTRFVDLRSDQSTWGYGVPTMYASTVYDWYDETKVLQSRYTRHGYGYGRQDSFSAPPDVQSLVDNINKYIRENMPPPLPQPEPQSRFAVPQRDRYDPELTKAVVKRAVTQYTTGELAFVLADGKISNERV
jgi:hypothetical protein